MSPDPGSRQGCVGATRVDAAQRLPRRGQEQKENGGRVLAELRTSQRTCKFFSLTYEALVMLCTMTAGGPLPRLSGRYCHKQLVPSIPRLSAPSSHLLSKMNALGTYFSTRHLCL